MMSKIVIETTPELAANTGTLDDNASLREQVIHAMRNVYDPELPVNIYDLGLIYRCDIDADGKVSIDMTLTSPACPVAGELPEEVRQAVQKVAGVCNVSLQLVWEPAWTKDRMSDAAQLECGLF